MLTMDCQLTQECFLALLVCLGKRDWHTHFTSQCMRYVSVSVHAMMKLDVRVNVHVNVNGHANVIAISILIANLNFNVTMHVNF